MPLDAQLDSVADGVFVWQALTPSLTATNVGVVVDDDGLTLVDTLCVPSQAARLAAALEPLGRRVRRIIYTSSHIAYVGGSSVFTMAARYGRSLTSARLDQPANVEALRRLHPEVAEEFDDLVTRPVSHTVDTAAWLSPTVCVVPVVGESMENLAVVLPERDVVLAGALGCFGVTPNAFEGDPAGWADSIGDLAETASVVVPGIGAVGRVDDVIAQQAYLYACVDADGDPARIPPGPWDAWAGRHLDEVNVERAARLAAGDDGVPRSMLRLLGMA